MIPLTACLPGGVEELYSLPRYSEMYSHLQAMITQEAENGYELSAPGAGYYRQSVQFHDLDGDDIDEALVFLRGLNQNLKICIYRRIGGDFELTVALEGEGTAIGRVDYANLAGDEADELVVAWQLSPATLERIEYFSGA